MVSLFCVGALRMPGSKMKMISASFPLRLSGEHITVSRVSGKLYLIQSLVCEWANNYAS